MIRREDYDTPYFAKTKTQLFGVDPDRIGLLGKPSAAENSFPSKSQ
jgi:hypothetical protein